MRINPNVKLQSKTIPIKGMHCKSCTVMVFDELARIPGIRYAKVNLRTNSAKIQFIEEPTEQQIEKAINQAGYTIGAEMKTFFSRDESTYYIFVVSIVLVFIALLLFQRLGFSGINIYGISNNKSLMAVAVGLTAGFSTCMALVGGLVLGLSSRFAEKHQSSTITQKFKPHLFFNLGRILSFFVLGGVIGLFGSLFSLNSSLNGALIIIIGLVMLVLGLQLTELFPKLANKGITLPAGLAKIIGLDQHKQKEYSHKNALILGGLTFFLPCGFTQAMQLVAIGSGSFITGSIVMGLFAIGTTPGLLAVGGLTSVIKGKPAKILFRFAGALVVLLAIYNISNGFNLTGFKFSLGSGESSGSSSKVVDTSNATALKTVFTPSSTGPQDISPNTFKVKAGKPYLLSVYATEDGIGCMSTIMIPGISDTPQLLTKGIVNVPFKIDKPGTYNITCAMGIVRGTIVATEGGSS